MTKADESFIRRTGFPLSSEDAEALLDFINLINPTHDMVEAEIIVKLELIADRYRIVKA